MSNYNNYELQYKTPMNDLPEHEEVVTEKPYYDNGSAPPLNPKEKNEIKHSEPQPKVEKEKFELDKNTKIGLIMYAIFFLLLITDIIIEVCCKIFDPWLLPDNIAGVGITIIFVIYFIIKRSLGDSNGTLMCWSGAILIVASIVKFVGIYMVELTKKAISKGNGTMLGVGFLSLGKLVFICLSAGYLLGH